MAAKLGRVEHTPTPPAGSGPAARPDGSAELAVAAEAEIFSAERLIFFSDAVVAIAITLLALDLPAPQGVTNSEVLHSAGTYVDQYVAFLISFVVIAGHWRGHHRVFRYVRDVGPVIRWNLLWLLFIVITPFATRVLNGEGAFQARFILYAAVQALAALSLLLIVATVRRRGLLRPEHPADIGRTSVIRLTGLSLGFLISIPVSLVTTWAYVCWAAIPLLSRGVRWLADRIAPETARV